MYCMRCGAPVEDVPVVDVGVSSESTRCARCRLHFARTPGLNVPPHDTQVLSRTTPLHCRREETDLVCPSCGSHCEVITFQRGLLRAMVARCANCALTAVDALDREPLRSMADGLSPSASLDEPSTAKTLRAPVDRTTPTQPLLRSVPADTAKQPKPANSLGEQLQRVVGAFVLTPGPERS